MIKLTKGQKLQEKNGKYLYTVMAVVDGATFLQYGQNSTALWYSDQEIEDGFILPKERFTPKEGERYWYVETIGEVNFATFCGSYLGDILHQEVGNFFPDEASAKAVAVKVKELFKKL